MAMSQSKFLEGKLNGNSKWQGLSHRAKWHKAKWDRAKASKVKTTKMIDLNDKNCI